MLPKKETRVSSLNIRSFARLAYIFRYAEEEEEKKGRIYASLKAKTSLRVTEMMMMRRVVRAVGRMRVSLDWLKIFFLSRKLLQFLVDNAKRIRIVFSIFK